MAELLATLRGTASLADGLVYVALTLLADEMMYHTDYI